MLSRMLICSVAALALLANLGFAHEMKSAFSSYDAFETYESEYYQDQDLSSMLEDSLSIVDPVFEPLNLDNELDRKIYDVMVNDEEFKDFRHQKYMLSFGMTAEQYDSAFFDARETLISVAQTSGLSVNIATQSYEDVLEQIALSASSNAHFLQSSEFVSLYTSSIFFQDLKNLEDPVINDILLGTPAIAKRFINWLIRTINSHKCSWCKKIVNKIRKKLCGAAGNAMCGLAAHAFGPFEPLALKYVCHSPFNVARIFSGWCQAGIKFIQRKSGLTDHKVCGFSIPRFSVAGQSVNIGKVCR